MKLPRTTEFLKQCPRAQPNMDDTNVLVKCCFCGDSNKSNHGHLSIKIDVNAREPLMYKCFRADCQKKGILTTAVLQQLGCTDMETILELAQHNKGISSNLERPFNDKISRNYALVNLDIGDNRKKLAYINKRLGTDFNTGDLRNFKIQLGLYEFLRVNYISRLAFPKQYCDVLDEHTIGFVSMYSDYLICRDISEGLKTGKRYTMYRASGRSDPNDMKIYAIPTEIDLIDPDPAEINVAEGPFSILGAWLWGKVGHKARNNIWLANCGSEFKNTIIHTVKQYGLTDAIIHIWSDSEIKIKKYEALLQSLEPIFNVVRFYVHYNEIADDFGHAKSEIKRNTISLK